MEPSATLCGSAPVFVVADVLASVAHYRDVLGFHTELTYGEPVSYAGVERDGVVIHLQAANATARPAGQSAMNVFVTDADRLYRELRGNGAQVLNEPADRPYGMRDFTVRDVDGNQLCFGMESPTSPPPA